MNLTRKQLNELKALSKEVFGNESKYKKLLERGYYHEETEEKEETIPEETKADGTIVPAITRKVQVPILNENRQRVRTVVYHTYESILELMQNFKKQKDEFMAKWQKDKEDAETAKKAQEEAGGSAV